MTLVELETTLEREGYEPDGTVYRRGDVTVEIRRSTNHVITRRFGSMVRQTITYISRARFVRFLEDEQKKAAKTKGTIAW